MGDKSFIVIGEASESEDEDYMSPIHGADRKAAIASILNEIGSDDELNITVGAFASKVDEATSSKYNSLLHRKLQESNWKLREDVKSYVRSHYSNAYGQVNEINQWLLATQIEAQNTVTLLRRSAFAASNVNLGLGAILSEKFIPDININV